MILKTSQLLENIDRYTPLFEFSLKKKKEVVTCITIIHYFYDIIGNLMSNFHTHCKKYIKN